MKSESKSNLREVPASGSGKPSIRDYELLRVVGSGSYGEVWLARTLAGTFRAIKIVRRAPPPDDRCFDREFTGILKFEAISHKHPGWVRILHLGRNDQAGWFYYVMEVADDCSRKQEIIPEDYSPRTLSSDLRDRGRLPIKECVTLGLSLTAALEELHRHKLVHRDIKPSNVIYVNSEPKLADIGLVAPIDEPPTSWLGTDGYLPPEVSGTASGDIFSLGRLLYVCWTAMAARDFPELPDDLDDGGEGLLTRKLNDLILTACDYDPNRRFKSAQAMHVALRGLLEANDPHRAHRGPAIISAHTGAKGPASTTRQPRVVVLCYSSGEQALHLARMLQVELGAKGCSVVVDRQISAGIEWAWQIENKVPEADAMVVLLSAESIESEMLLCEMEMAKEGRLRHGRPILIPVRIRYSEPPPYSLSRLLTGMRFLQWESQDDEQELIGEILRALESPTEWPMGPATSFEAPWGAIPLESTFYVVRHVDNEFRAAITRRDSIVLIKGARQMGKSSLLARGLNEARNRGVLVVFTDFQGLSMSDFDSLDRFYHALGNSIADQLDLSVCAEDKWDGRRSANTNFDRFLRREIFEKLNAQIVWGLDEVDRLFTCSFGSEVFGMFRSWHNKRALDPEGHWGNLTLAIAYATEAHLFISDLNQSPFNVGTPLSLEDFDRDQVADLNRRYGSPLQDEEQLSAFFRLVNGHPFLVRRGLHELATRKMKFDLFAAQATRDEGIFGDHLRRLLVSLAKDGPLLEVVRGALRGEVVAAESFYRLRAAGVIAGETAGEARLRCEVYAEYLRGRLL